MNTDFRLSVGIFSHVKMRKLNLRLGKEAGFALIQLFHYVAMNKPDGVLSDMDNDDIILAADYTGDGDFIATLKELRWLDVNDNNVLSIHDWADHNPWAAGAIARSDAARIAANARWNKYRMQDAEKNTCGTDAPRIENDAQRIKMDAPRIEPQCPISSPLLSESGSLPKEENKEEKSPQPPEGESPPVVYCGDSHDPESILTHLPELGREIYSRHPNKDSPKLFAKVWNRKPLISQEQAEKALRCIKENFTSPPARDELPVIAGASVFVNQRQWNKDCPFQGLAIYRERHRVSTRIPAAGIESRGKPVGRII